MTAGQALDIVLMNAYAGLALFVSPFWLAAFGLHAVFAYRSRRWE